MTPLASGAALRRLAQCGFWRETALQRAQLAPMQMRVPLHQLFADPQKAAKFVAKIRKCLLLARGQSQRRS